ncbi:competence type IV pilus ATPase ComGA [Lactobacillus sp. LL6]|uniref:competence type IV pilus ATPase ComGA n=1 Tax=Lactobacillus sp. LL6 TaxID=2596827 RepID=UPI00118595C0|nr:competence type IV pilus ATPase ComGA [Lactobacillus sp. LL6]TSO26083.1 AAA family ATPase [Lactobacillus sp. LL6]
METKQIVDKLLEEAIAKKASDIFFLIKEENVQVNLRLSSGIESLTKYNQKQGIEIINFFKYAAQMDISEHQRPQVGAIEYDYQEQKYYLRLSSLGDFADKESLVVRIIYQIENSNYFFTEQIKLLESLSKKRGLIITSGPTGSGKTTTMYELAKKVSQNKKVVMTIEDPVEIHESSFLQSQVNSEAGIEYLDLLKAALRHRPDILIIGEIRDANTARVALDAALSGHLVFATVHAQSTFQTISRLEGLGIRKDELANCLTAISYQRLLPTKSNVACLLDIASGESLKEAINSQIRSNFVDWQNNLNTLKKGGQINDETYSFYQEG